MIRGLALVLLIVLFLSPVAAQDDEDGIRYTIGGVTVTKELVMTANYPVSLAFAPDGRLFYTEKTTGNVRVINTDGTRQTEPVITLPTSALAERGMLGIAFDPGYAENGYIWVFHTREGTTTDWPANNVVRFREEGGTGSDPQVMLSVPVETGALIHNGGNLHFDDAGLLYVTYGNLEDPAHSQDLSTIPGAIHRFAVTETGLEPAPDNPFEDSSIYAYGLRNAYDFAFDSTTDFVYATENGQHCDDELNLIVAGFNYGAGPDYVCGNHTPGIEEATYLPPMLSFTPTIAPTAVIIYDHEAVPAWRDKLFFCAWNATQPLRLVTLNEARSNIADVEEVDLGARRCRIDLTVGPDGALYYTTVDEIGGAIYRLVPD